MQTNKKCDTRVNTWKQWYSALVVNIICFCHGCTVGWLSPTLPLLSGPDSPFDASLTPSDINMIGSMMSLAAAMFTLIFGWIADKFGRRFGLILSGIPYMICWIIKISSYSSTGLIIARFFSGIGSSGITVIAPIYCIEIANQSLKGAFGSLMLLSNNIGVLVTYTLGMYLGYEPLIWFVLLQPILFIMLMYFIPESPSHLLKKEILKEAEKALAWLNNDSIESEVVKNELSIIRNEIKLIEDTGSESILRIFKTSPETLKAFLVVLTLFTIQIFMGMMPITSYAENIFQQAGTNISPSICSVLLGSMMLIGSFIACSLVEKLGRKILLLGSCAAVALSLLITGIYFYVQNSGVNTEGLRIIPVIALPVAVCTFTLGAGPLPYVLTVELITPKIRGVTSGIILTFIWFLLFLITFFFGPAVELIGMSGVFIFFGLCAVTGFVHVFFNIPETKGHSLQESLSFYSKS